MKKIYLLLLCFLVCSGTQVFGQAVLFTEAPVFDNSTSTGRGPNGTSAHQYMRACGLVKASELTGIANGATISTFGFTLNSGASVNAPVGSFTLYLQNTPDNTYNKGTSFSAALAGMTQVYANSMTIPISATSTSVIVTLSTPFVYGGNSIYVAYDWFCPGPYSTALAVYRCNSGGLSPGLASIAAATGPAPDALGTTAFRPCFLWGVVNTNTNEVSVNGVEAPGRLSGMIGTAHNVQALIRNNSNTALSNIVTTLNVAGANTFANTQTITSLAAGAITTVTFATFTPLNAGLNAMIISVPADQNNSNNSGIYTQSITCNEWALNPAAMNYTMGAVGFNTGSGIIGVRYASPATSTLTGLRGGISTNTPAIGNNAWGVLLSSTGAILATTNTVAITSGMLGTSPTFTFATPPVLAPTTTYYIGFAQPTGTIGYFPMGTYTSAYVPFLNYVTTTTVGGTPAPLTSNLGYFDIQAIFAPTLALSVNSPSILCGNTATLTATTPGTYSWTSGPNNTNHTVTPLNTTNYTVNASSTFGCAASRTTAVVVTPISVAAMSSPPFICVGDNVVLTASGANTYSWSPGPVTPTVTFSDAPVVTTTYVVQGTNTAGCTNSISVVVTVYANPTLAVTATSLTLLCGDSSTLSATSDGSYIWTGGPINANYPVTPTVNTTYTAIATNTDGCTATQTIALAVNPLTITAAISNSVICVGQTVTLTATGAPNYTWNAGAFPGTPTFTVAPATSTVYAVVGANAAGCSGSANTAITVNSFTNLSVAPTSATNMCSGESTTLTASGGVSYVWTGSSPGATLAVNTTTATTLIYTVTGTASNSCTATSTIALLVSACTGIEEQFAGNSYNVYPNPFKDKIVFVSDVMPEHASLIVYNMLGEIVLQQNNVETKTELNLSNADAGIYMVVLKSEDKVLSTRKIIKE